MAPQVAHHPIKKGDNTWSRTDKERAGVCGKFLQAVFTAYDGDAETKKIIQTTWTLISNTAF